jgi:hypothetical protein
MNAIITITKYVDFLSNREGFVFEETFTFNDFSSSSCSKNLIIKLREKKKYTKQNKKKELKSKNQYN